MGVYNISDFIEPLLKIANELEKRNKIEKIKLELAIYKEKNKRHSSDTIEKQQAFVNNLSKRLGEIQ